jgi:hypothetical protein
MKIEFGLDAGTVLLRIVRSCGRIFGLAGIYPPHPVERRYDCRRYLL